MNKDTNYTVITTDGKWSARDGLTYFKKEATHSTICGWAEEILNRKGSSLYEEMGLGWHEDEDGDIVNDVEEFNEEQMKQELDIAEDTINRDTLNGSFVIFPQTKEGNELLADYCKDKNVA